MTYLFSFLGFEKIIHKALCKAENFYYNLIRREIIKNNLQCFQQEGAYMKKFLFFLTFALVSSLFSGSIFKEKIHELIVDCTLNDTFLKNPELKKAINLTLLKQIAEKYSDASTKQEINIQNVTNHFSSCAAEDLEFAIDQAEHSIEQFVDIFEQWQNSLKEILMDYIASNKLQSLVVPSHLEGIIALIATKPNELEEIIYFLIQEETEIFTQTLIKTCKKYIKTWNFETTMSTLYKGLATGLVSAILVNEFLKRNPILIFGNKIFYPRRH